MLTPKCLLDSAKHMPHLNVFPDTQAILHPRYLLNPFTYAPYPKYLPNYTNAYQMTQEYANDNNIYRKFIHMRYSNVARYLGSAKKPTLMPIQNIYQITHICYIFNF